MCHAFRHSSPPDARDASFEEIGAHRLAGAKDAILNGAERQTRDFRNLVITHIVRVPQHNQLSVRPGEILHDFFNLGAALGLLALLLGSQCRARERLFVSACAVVPLALPPGDLDFKLLAAPTGLAALAWA